MLTAVSSFHNSDNFHSHWCVWCHYLQEVRKSILAMNKWVYENTPLSFECWFLRNNALSKGRFNGPELFVVSSWEPQCCLWNSVFTMWRYYLIHGLSQDKYNVFHKELCACIILVAVWWQLDLDFKLPDRNRMFSGVAWSAYRFLADMCVCKAVTLPLLLWLAQGHLWPTVCICQQCRKRQNRRQWQDVLLLSLNLSLFLPLPSSSLLFYHARRFVKDRVQAEGWQIDYPTCRKCVQGLRRQTGNKQRPFSEEALKHTRANVIIKRWRHGILRWYSLVLQMLNHSGMAKSLPSFGSWCVLHISLRLLM